jgi:hypothetical protein
MQTVGSLGKQAQLQAAHRSFGHPEGATRVDSGDQAENALVLRRQAGRSCAMQLLPLERAAKAPIKSAVEREVTPGGDPLRALGDFIGLDLVVHRLLDGHVAIDQQAVPSVVQVRGVAQQLTLRDFVHRRDRVLVMAERVLPERRGADSRHAVGDLDDRQPAAGQQGR